MLAQSTEPVCILSLFKTTYVPSSVLTQYMNHKSEQVFMSSTCIGFGWIRRLVTFSDPLAWEMTSPSMPVTHWHLQSLQTSSNDTARASIASHSPASSEPFGLAMAPPSKPFCSAFFRRYLSMDWSAVGYFSMIKALMAGTETPLRSSSSVTASTSMVYVPGLARRLLGNLLSPIVVI